MKTKSIKCNFKNTRGYMLDARLDVPASFNSNDKQSTFIIFCHCFTCSKETITTFRLSRQLAAQGYAVLRFDFTGLGNSEGEFSSTTFETTQDDLRSAINFLNDNYQAPEFLMGHSLGGTTALSVASEYDSIKGVVTVASPSEPDHVLHHFGHALTLLEQNSPASFEVAGTYFDIEPAFLNDVRSIDMPKILSDLVKPVLIFNIDNDSMVNEENALDIEKWTAGETRLINISGSDHLISGRDKTAVVAADIVKWMKGI